MTSHVFDIRITDLVIRNNGLPEDNSSPKSFCMKRNALHVYLGLGCIPVSIPAAHTNTESMYKMNNKLAIGNIRLPKVQGKIESAG